MRFRKMRTLSVLAGAVVALAGCSSPAEGTDHGEGIASSSASDESGGGAPEASDPITTEAFTPAEATTPTEQVIADLVDEINAGDAAGAMEFVCEGSESVVQTAVDDLAREQPDLRVESFAPDGPDVVTATAIGSAGGEPVTATIGAGQLSTGACVAALFVT